MVLHFDFERDRNDARDLKNCFPEVPMSGIVNTAALDNLMKWHNTEISLYESHFSVDISFQPSFINLKLHFFSPDPISTTYTALKVVVAKDIFTVISRSYST